MPQPDDAYSAMLALSTQLAAKEAAGQRLSTDERIIADIVWIDVQVAPNGFDGWLCYTSNEAIQRTLDALDTVGCSRVAVLVKNALAVAGIDPANMSDDARHIGLVSTSWTMNSTMWSRIAWSAAAPSCAPRSRSFPI